MKWHNDDPTDWECKWYVGDVIGFVANMETGMIASSKNGNWEDSGVAFESESIKAGVYPCFTGMRCEVRYSFNEEVKYGPPPGSFWNTGERSD